MIRFVLTTSLLALIVMVLYLPSTHPSEHFIDQLRIEHSLNIAFWGEDHAARILSRTRDLQNAKRLISPIPSPANVTAANGVDTVAAHEMSQVNRRFFSNPYFKSIDALLTLAAYRLSALIEWLPILQVFMFAVLFDGFVVRIVKSKEFLQHNPEKYALHACAAIMTACAAVVGFAAPVTLQPLWLPVVPVAVSMLVSRAVANFHRRG
jgi:hypothetical protein